MSAPVADDADFALRPPSQRVAPDLGKRILPEHLPARHDASPPLATGRRAADGPADDPARVGRRQRPAHRQNGMGDVVVPVANGEIVALPRLWNFDLTELSDDAGVLHSDTGLIAVIALDGDSAVVTDVTEADVRRTA